MALRLGILLRYKGSAPLDMDIVLEAERLGFDSVWSGESYSTDAVTPIAWVLSRTTRIKAGTGIMQMPGRSPACAAMTAMTLQALSGNRFLMGIGPSGPQVAEGWHGERFGKPITRTKEYISIVREILDRQRPLKHLGEHYRIPYDGPGATGLGKPLKSILHPDPNLKLYTAAITPAGLRAAGEIADGTLPIWMIPERPHPVTEPVLEGMARSPLPKTLGEFDIGVHVRVCMGDDLEACRDALRPELALYIGGMGARDKNFYNDYMKRLGFEEAAAEIQNRFLTGDRKGAAAAVPDSFVDATCLVGPADRIRERMVAWKEAARDGSVGTMLVPADDPATLRLIAEAAFS